MIDHYPAFAICGYSGSGKTTVIEVVARTLSERGLRVCIVKHDVHGLNIDHEGKDTDRFFKAGADVIIRGPEQSFFRAHRTRDMPMSELLELVGPGYDMVLVEGHKSTPLPQKVWMCGEQGDPPPPEAKNIKRVMKREEDRVQIVMDMIDEWLPRTWCSCPVYAGILSGDNTDTLRQADLERTVETLSEYVDNVVLVGNASGIKLPSQVLSVVPDTPGVNGPVAGMRAAMRWMPGVSWIFLPCNLAGISGSAVNWLLSQRQPGIWVVQPRLEDSQYPEPLFAYYDFRSAALVSRSGMPSAIATNERTSHPVIPQAIQAAWQNG